MGYWVVLNQTSFLSIYAEGHSGLDSHRDLLQMWLPTVAICPFTWRPCPRDNLPVSLHGELELAVSIGFLSQLLLDADVGKPQIWWCHLSAQCVLLLGSLTWQDTLLFSGISSLVDLRAPGCLKRASPINFCHMFWASNLAMSSYLSIDWFIYYLLFLILICLAVYLINLLILKRNLSQITLRMMQHSNTNVIRYFVNGVRYLSGTETFSLATTL